MERGRRAAGGQIMESYIVRIYRRERDDIVGVVELPAEEQSFRFRSFAELHAILLRESEANLPKPGGE